MNLIAILFDVLGEIGPAGLAFASLMAVFLLMPVIALAVLTTWQFRRKLSGTRGLKVLEFTVLGVFCLPLAIPGGTFDFMALFIPMAVCSFFSGAIIYDCYQKLDNPLK